MWRSKLIYPFLLNCLIFCERFRLHMLWRSKTVRCLTLVQSLFRRPSTSLDNTDHLSISTVNASSGVGRYFMLVVSHKLRLRTLVVRVLCRSAIHQLRINIVPATLLHRLHGISSCIGTTCGRRSPPRSRFPAHVSCLAQQPASPVKPP